MPTSEYQWISIGVPTNMLLTILRDLSVLRASKDELFVLSSGKTSKTYVDIRRTALTAVGLQSLSEALLHLIEALNVSPGLVAGVALGGCPLASGISLYTAMVTPPLAFLNGYLGVVYVRKGAKDHGTGKLIEGIYEPGDRVVLVEDVVTSGASSLKAIQILKEAGLHVVGVVAVLDREEGGREAIETQCPFKAITTLSQLLAK